MKQEFRILEVIEPDGFVDSPADTFVKPGHDTGDRFAIFPYVDRNEQELPDDLWSRSFSEAKDSARIFSIATDAFDVCVRDLAIDLFDPSFNRAVGRPSYCGDMFEEYGPNLFSKKSCDTLVSLLCERAEKLAAANLGTFAYSGDYRIMRAKDAASCCRKFAILLSDLVTRTGCDVVCFDGP